MNEIIKQIVADQAGEKPENISDETILEDLGLDSLDAVEIAMFIEDEFDIEFGDGEMDQSIKKGLTFGDLVKCVEGKVRDAD